MLPLVLLLLHERRETGSSTSRIAGRQSHVEKFAKVLDARKQPIRALTDPAPVMPAMQPRRSRAVQCSRFVRFSSVTDPLPNHKKALDRQGDLLRSKLSPQQSSTHSVSLHLDRLHDRCQDKQASLCKS